jgi:excisionase family DNA binding protein
VLKRSASTALARGRWPVFVSIEVSEQPHRQEIPAERHQKSADLKILHYEGEILTLKQVADFLKVTERTIYRLAAAGKIPAFKVGGTWRFSRAEINRMDSTAAKRAAKPIRRNSQEGLMTQQTEAMNRWSSR